NVRLPTPVQTTAPPFSRVRRRLILLGLPRRSVAPGAMTVRPPPSISPAVQFIALLTVTVPLPSSDKLARSRFEIDKSALASIVPPFIRQSPPPLSCAPGTSVGVPLLKIGR